MPTTWAGWRRIASRYCAGAPVLWHECRGYGSCRHWPPTLSAEPQRTMAAEPHRTMACGALTMGKRGGWGITFSRLKKTSGDFGWRKEHRAVGWVEGGAPLVRSGHTSRARPLGSPLAGKPNAKSGMLRRSLWGCWVSAAQGRRPQMQNSAGRPLPNLRFMVLIDLRLTLDFFVPVAPIGINGLDEGNLLGARMFLDLFFPCNCVRHCVQEFIVDENVNAVSGGEAVDEVLFVNRYAPCKIAVTPV